MYLGKFGSLAIILFVIFAALAAPAQTQKKSATKAKVSKSAKKPAKKAAKKPAAKKAAAKPTTAAAPVKQAPRPAPKAATKPVATPEPTPEPTPKPTPKPKAKPSKTISRIGVGSGYMIFSEQLKVSDGGVPDDAIANYAGLVIFADHTWTKKRVVYQAALGIGTGKATASGFSSASYPDSGKRTWTLAYFEGSISYRVNPNISTGVGMIGGSQSGDWKSQVNTGLTVSGQNKTIYAPELVFRWNVTRKVTLVQSLASPDLRGHTMWRWTGQYNF